jgi:hypothetical protein
VKVRIAAFISPNANRRLRLYALNTGQRVGDALSQIIDQGTPSLTELTTQAAQDGDGAQELGEKAGAR